MNIDDLTVKQIKEINNMLSLTGSEKQSAQEVDHGLCIVVADGRWNFVGECRQVNEMVIVEIASVVRYWGTTRGLGEIAAGGPTEKTKLDPCGQVKLNEDKLIGLIPCAASHWKGKLLSPGEDDQ